MLSTYLKFAIKAHCSGNSTITFFHIRRSQHYFMSPTSIKVIVVSQNLSLNFESFSKLCSRSKPLPLQRHQSYLWDAGRARLKLYIQNGSTNYHVILTYAAVCREQEYKPQHGVLSHTGTMVRWLGREHRLPSRLFLTLKHKKNICLDCGQPNCGLVRSASLSDGLKGNSLSEWFHTDCQ
jgi:hypothetical protein